MALKLTAEEAAGFLIELFPGWSKYYDLLSLDEQGMRLKMFVQERHLRPGGTVSGPAVFAMVDAGAYLLTMAHIGREAMTVTSNCSIDYMRKPVAGADIIGEFRLLKLGRTLCVMDVLVYSEGDPAPVARANITYAIPPARQKTD
ncbi:MAG: PaaI family thioesterase [Aquisalinus sp.]|nr:PaaI family thioesterase [Aquisalinus sp.]